MVADYDLVRVGTDEHATLVVEEARQFVDACASKWSFGDRVTDERED